MVGGDGFEPPTPALFGRLGAIRLPAEMRVSAAGRRLLAPDDTDDYLAKVHTTRQLLNSVARDQHKRTPDFTSVPKCVALKVRCAGAVKQDYEHLSTP